MVHDGGFFSGSEFVSYLGNDSVIFLFDSGSSIFVEFSMTTGTYVLNQREQKTEARGLSIIY